MKIYGVRRFALAIGIACLPLAFLGSWLGRWCAVPAEKEPEQPCGDAYYDLGQYYHFGCDSRSELQFIDAKRAVCKCAAKAAPEVKR